MPDDLTPDDPTTPTPMILQVIVTIPLHSPLTINFSPRDYAFALPTWGHVKARLTAQTHIPAAYQKLTTMGGMPLGDGDKIVRSEDLETGMGPDGEVIINVKPVVVRLELRRMILKATTGCTASGAGINQPKKRGRDGDVEEGESTPFETHQFDIDIRSPKRIHTIRAF
ncbi:hypothetical protein HDV00_002874 [Rhizophlyctis rosea]|nr:hypothetical protein HDV00_002874 [Rhizophlyctis rosea]